MTSDPLMLMGIGGGLVLLLVVLVVASVALIVHKHEVTEMRLDAERHNEITRSLDDFRRLVMAAINGRAAMSQDVENLKVKVTDLDSRVRDLEET